MSTSRLLSDVIRLDFLRNLVFHLISNPINRNMFFFRCQSQILLTL